MADNKKLDLWKKRLERNFTEYADEVERMDHREELYRGTKDMHNAHTGKTVLKEATHVRNIIAEIIEAEVDSNIPQPKVTPRRKEDEHLAQIIEDMLRGELDRMRFEEYNDMQERTVPIQGGGLWLVEWDNSLRTHTTIGEVAVSLVHPKQIVPQAGVYTGIEDMDYIILKMPQTKAYIKRKYGVDVKDESEEEPEVKGGRHRPVLLGAGHRAGGSGRLSGAALEALQELRRGASLRHEGQRREEARLPQLRRHEIRGRRRGI